MAPIVAELETSPEIRGSSAGTPGAHPTAASPPPSALIPRIKTTTIQIECGLSASNGPICRSGNIGSIDHQGGAGDQQDIRNLVRADRLSSRRSDGADRGLPARSRSAPQRAPASNGAVTASAPSSVVATRLTSVVMPGSAVLRLRQLLSRASAVMHSITIAIIHCCGIRAAFTHSPVRQRS